MTPTKQVYWGLSESNLPCHWRRQLFVKPQSHKASGGTFEYVEFHKWRHVVTDYFRSNVISSFISFFRTSNNYLIDNVMRLSISLNMVKHFLDGGKKNPFFSSRKDHCSVTMVFMLPLANTLRIITKDVFAYGCKYMKIIYVNCREINEYKSDLRINDHYLKAHFYPWCNARRDPISRNTKLPDY